MLKVEFLVHEMANHDSALEHKIPSLGELLAPNNDTVSFWKTVEVSSVNVKHVNL